MGHAVVGVHGGSPAVGNRRRSTWARGLQRGQGRLRGWWGGRHAHDGRERGGRRVRLPHRLCLLLGRHKARVLVPRHGACAGRPAHPLGPLRTHLGLAPCPQGHSRLGHEGLKGTGLSQRCSFPEVALVLAALPAGQALAARPPAELSCVQAALAVESVRGLGCLDPVVGVVGREGVAAISVDGCEHHHLPLVVICVVLALKGPLHGCELGLGFCVLGLQLSCLLLLSSPDLQLLPKPIFHGFGFCSYWHLHLLGCAFTKLTVLSVVRGGLPALFARRRTRSAVACWWRNHRRPSTGCF
mmetsp:Transcript_21315/g.46553  ORF Transcript_21315/g.46553 Transcript_21315/m.46553 type:complete len:299 (-) Transcript_21315:595-1491(-)